MSHASWNSRVSAVSWDTLDWKPSKQENLQAYRFSCRGVITPTMYTYSGTIEVEGELAIKNFHGKKFEIKIVTCKWFRISSYEQLHVKASSFALSWKIQSSKFDRFNNHADPALLSIQLSSVFTAKLFPPPVADNRRIVNEVNQRGTGGAACRRENGTAQISQYPAISDRSFYFPKVALHQSFVERTSRTREKEK